MATALSTQLAAIAASSTNQLDLKAQRRAHSQSLIFEPRDAALQDFDTIYDICIQGFHELCHLDPRFKTFAKTVFSDQSKVQDRTQLTSAENEELDAVLERFLRLVCSKVLLQPAIQAVEWLVRRFRIHEYNTLCLILTFLPYHTLPVFATLLSIVPKKLAPATKFLHPYVESLAAPPRHAVAYAATNNIGFFTAWNNYVLKSCYQKSYSQAMVSYWATVMTEAVTGQLDQTASGRIEAQRQKEEDILLRILPVLSKGLAMKHVPDLRVGCYMILSVLASRANLDDKVLLGFIEAVVSGGTKETSHAELICISILAQQRTAIGLPPNVIKSLLSITTLTEDLVILSERYRVSNLAYCLASATIQQLGAGSIPQHPELTAVSIRQRLLKDGQVLSMIESIVAVARSMGQIVSNRQAALKYLGGYMQEALASSHSRPLAEDALEKANLKLEELESLLFIALPLSAMEDPSSLEAASVENYSPGAHDITYDLVKADVPQNVASGASLLSNLESHVFERLEAAFVLASRTSSDIEDFINLPVFRNSGSGSDLLILSFFSRFWCGPSSTNSRAAAIKSASKGLEEIESSVDAQFLLPYALSALSDPIASIRRAAVSLLASLARLYTQAKGKDNSSVLGMKDLYSAQRTAQISWLSQQDVNALLHEVLIPNLEEYAIDQGHIADVMREALSGVKQESSPGVKSKALKSTVRASVLRFLASHATQTPLYNVKSKLMGILKDVSKAGGVSKTEVFLPLLSAHVNMSEPDLSRLCAREKLDSGNFASDLVGVVSPSSQNGNQVLQNIIVASEKPSPRLWIYTIFRHITVIWDAMKPNMQTYWAKILWEVGVFKSQSSNKQAVVQNARETLMNVTLPVECLLDSLEHVPRLSTDIEHESQSSKRRKTSSGAVKHQVVADTEELSENLRKITTVLEILETSKRGNDICLLPYLFRVLQDLQRCVSALGHDLSYTQSLALSSITRIVEHLRTSGASLIDQQSIRVDMVIDSFKSTSSLQVQQQALQLLSSLATVAPDLIVHSVMPIFTFMGNSVMRQSDENSARIVDSTIESVIPPLIASFRKRKGGSLGGASELILSFAAAFEHIPVHRRHELLTAVMQKLGEEDYLYVLLIILVDRHNEKSALLEFLAQLIGQYSPLVQLKTIHNCVDVALDSIKLEPRITQQILSFDKGRDRENTSKVLIELPSRLLKVTKLSSRVAKAVATGTEVAMGIRSLYSAMVEQALRLADEAKSFASLHSPCDFLLDSLLNFLPLSESLTSLNALLKSESQSVRRKVLNSFEQRISAAKAGDSASENACFQLLPQLLLLLDASGDVQLKRSAIACVDRIADKYGKKNITVTAKAANAIAGEGCLGSQDPQLQTMALLCSITLVEVLREAIVPMIPLILPRSLDLLDSSLSAKSQADHLHNAVFSFFSSLFLYLPWIVSGRYLHRFLELSYSSAASELSMSSKKIRTDSLDLLATQIQAHEVVDALQNSWDQARRKGERAILEHLDTFRKVIERHPKSMIIKESQSLMTSFLKVMDLRQDQELPSEDVPLDTDQIEQIERNLNEIMVKMIYKLNDTHFRPLFIKMSEWAAFSRGKKDKRAKACREISLFSFLQYFFDTLQSIVTGYAAHIIDQAVEILSSYTTSQESASLLWERVVKTLHAMFTYDQDEFWRSPTRFTTVSTPLLAQLEHATELNMEPALIACITSFATATDSSDHLKVINSKLLEHLRSDNAKVRLAAVRCEMSLTESLGEEWLNLLPEMLPAISETMEDDDESVESEVRRWAKKIEDVLGESLDDMLQ